MFGSGKRKVMIDDVAPRLDAACARLITAYAGGNASLSRKYIGGYRRALVFQVTLDSGSEEQQFFVKVGRDTSESVRAFVAKEAARSTEVYEWFKSTPSLAVAQPASYDEDLAVFSTHAIRGERLDLAIIRAARTRNARTIAEMQDYVAKCGEWLESFQALAPDSGEVSTDELMVSVNRQLERLNRNNPHRFDSRFVDNVSNDFQSCAEHMPAPDRKRVLRHDDYAPWNVMCHSGQVIVFDFPNVQSGARHYDRFYFRGALKTLRNKLFVESRTIEGLCEAFDDSLPAQIRPANESTRYYALLFSLVRLGALIHLEKPGLLRAALNKARIEREVAILTGRS